MITKKHKIDHKVYEGEDITITTPDSLDNIIYNYYKEIKAEQVTGYNWSAQDDIFTLVLQLNDHIDISHGHISEGERLFMPKLQTNTADRRIKLWE